MVDAELQCVFRFFLKNIYLLSHQVVMTAHCRRGSSVVTLLVKTGRKSTFLLPLPFINKTKNVQDLYFLINYIYIYINAVKIQLLFRPLYLYFPGDPKPQSSVKI